MSNPQHLSELLKGPAAWNDWRVRGFVEPDLSEVNLAGADLHGADLHRANFSGADLHGADFHGANLTSAYLSEANFSGADLHGADLHGANLTSANFSGADLHGADLRWAILMETVFGDVNLSDVKGLDEVSHFGPSTIGIDTIYRSQGRIPESFLRGAGVPDNLITFMKSLTGAALEFYSCFISYSTADQGFADRLYTDLQSNGVRCWYAPHHIQAGKKLHEQIDEAIRVYDKLLVVLSENSMKSEWVKTELAKARRREVREHRRMLFPVCLVPFESLRDWECFDSYTGKDTASEICEYFIPDFSNWKDHNAYRPAFDRLLRDLKADAQQTSGSRP